MMDVLKQRKEQFKGNSESLQQKCKEIYVPPGVVKLTPTVFEKKPNVGDNIRLAQPSDKI